MLREVRNAFGPWTFLSGRSTNIRPMTIEEMNHSVRFVTILPQFQNLL